MSPRSPRFARAAAAAAAIAALTVMPSAVALDNGVARLPAMGYNTWNRYACNINETLVRTTAQQMKARGLQAAGYEFVNLDDCWLTHNRSADGKLVPDPVKFPSGLNNLSDYLHGLGFKFGIYEDLGETTCAGYPGTLGHELTDARSFAAWGVDYAKIDNCAVPSNYTNTTEQRYDVMRDALLQVKNETGKDIVFSLCEWGKDSVWTWGNATGNSWRMSDDINAHWASVISILNQAASITKYTGFTGHNDLDMLELGNGNLTIEEQRTHFTAWAFLKSPLLIGTDLVAASDETVAVLTNPEIIAISQDPVVGASIAPFANSTYPPETWSGPSQNGTVVMLINSESSPRNLSFSLTSSPYFDHSKTYAVRDLWAHRDLGTFHGDKFTYPSGAVASHDVVALLFTEKKAGMTLARWE